MTTYATEYKLYENILIDIGGSIIPSAITYRKQEDGSYVMEKYVSARDGTEFAPSIQEFCTMPVSKKEIKGLATKILHHYGDYKDIIQLERENLIAHLKNNNIYGVSLHQNQNNGVIIPLT